MKKCLLYTAILALLSAPVYAGSLSKLTDNAVTAPPIQTQPISWTGFYLGAQSGYGEARSSGTYSDPGIGRRNGDFFPLTFIVSKLDLTGGLGGVHVGYLRDMGQWVVGGELDYNWADFNGDFTANVVFPDFPAEGPLPASTELKIDRIGHAKLMIGYNFGGGLAYATAGAFHAEVNMGGLKLKDNGWVAGVGYKHKFSENWIGNFEALYHTQSYRL